MTREKVEYLIGQFALLAARADWKPKSIDRIRAFGDLALRALDRDAVQEDQVARAANVIAASPLIDHPKLPEMNWRGLARHILEAALKREPSAAPQKRPAVHIDTTRVEGVTVTGAKITGPGASDE